MPQLFNNKYTQVSIWNMSHYEFFKSIYSWNDGLWTEKSKLDLALSLLLPLSLDLHVSTLGGLCIGPLNNHLSKVYLNPVGLLYQKLVLLAWLIGRIFIYLFIFVRAPVAAKIKAWDMVWSHIGFENSVSLKKKKNWFYHSCWAPSVKQ